MSKMEEVRKSQEVDIYEIEDSERTISETHYLSREEQAR
jgi:hypothetical protein